MAGIYGMSAYQQTNQLWKTRSKDTRTKAAASKGEQVDSAREAKASKVDAKPWSPLEAASSLIPKKTEDYGYTIGDVELSDKAKEYLEELKSKNPNMEFITVSDETKDQVQKNAASYGNANKMVVLVDEEKLERMATDESYRKKYEGIIASAQTKLTMAKNDLASSGAGIKNFGMSVDSNGKESFFASVEKAQDAQKERIERKAAEKKAAKKAEKKAQEKKAAERKERKAEERKEQEEHIQKARDKKAKGDVEDGADVAEAEATEMKDYVTFEADSMEGLLSKVRYYSYDGAMNRVRTDAERMVGTRVDYVG